MSTIKKGLKHNIKNSLKFLKKVVNEIVQTLFGLNILDIGLS